MNCRKAEQMISLRRDGALRRVDEQALEFHLLECRLCRNTEQAYSALAIEAAELRGVTPTRALASLTVSKFRRAATGTTSRFTRIALTAAALGLLVGSIAVFKTWNAPGVRNPTQTTGSPSRIAVRQKPITAASNRRLAPTLETRNIVQPRRDKRAILAVNPISRSAQGPPDDLDYINENALAAYERWAGIESGDALRLNRQFDEVAGEGDDFVKVPYPAIASIDDKRAITSALASYQRETGVVDPRLTRRTTLALKGVSFDDLCTKLKNDSAIDISAGRSVADDKVTVFCREKPLRDLMRQITRVFGFQWRRTGESGTYAYELTQDLKSQLMEEELRNRDRNEALIALDNEMRKLHDLLKLSPDELRQKAAAASSPDEKRKLENLAAAWGAGQVYFALAPEEMSALRNGDYLQFSTLPMEGMKPLASGLASGIFSSMSGSRIQAGPDGVRIGPSEYVPDGTPPAQTPGAFAQAGLQIDRSDLGQFTMLGMSGIGIRSGESQARQNVKVPLGTGISPSVKNPQNAKANSSLAADPVLKRRMDILPTPSGRLEADPFHLRREPSGAPGENLGPLATTADVLEAIHRVSGRDVIGDYFTRLYTPESVTARNVTLWNGLNTLCDQMRIRWWQESSWLQFRSASFFNDRIKEIPGRLLESWAEKRKANGHLGVDDLAEIGSLTDAQLDPPQNARAARALYGLNEWELARSPQIRPHWRYFAGLSDQARRMALSQTGVSFAQLAPSHQQRFVGTVLAARKDTDITLEQVTKATMHVTFALKQPADVARHEQADALPDGPVRFTYRMPQSGQDDLRWDVEPFRSSFNSTNKQSQSITR